MDAEAHLLVNDVDISNLSDEELFVRLTDLGAIVGPVVGTTRKVYQRKLAVLMGASQPNCSFEANTTTNDEDDEREVEPTRAYIERVNAGSEARRRKPDLESRPVVPNEDDTQELATDEEEDGGDCSSRLYTPSPRRPLRSPEASPDTAYAYRAHQESYLSSPIASSSRVSPSKPEQKEQQEQSAGGGLSQMLLTIALVLLFAVIAYYFFMARPEKDGFSSLEDLAKTASDAIGKGDDKAGGPRRVGL